MAFCARIRSSGLPYLTTTISGHRLGAQWTKVQLGPAQQKSKTSAGWRMVTFEIHLA